MAEVKRRKSESFEALFRRFSRRVQESGKILQAKKIRFHEGELSKSKQKKSALRRKEMREKYDYLERSGQLKEEEPKGKKQ